MSKSLRSFPDYLRGQVALRRLGGLADGETGGLGYWGARDFIERGERERAARKNQRDIEQ